MKKLVSIVLVIMISVAMLAGCGGSGGSGDSGKGGSVDSLKTIGDIQALDADEYQMAQYPDDMKLIYAFKLGDSYYRATGEMTEETASALWDLAYDDPDHDKKQKELLDTIEITELEDLTGEILSKDALAALAGKTGQELLDEGWTANGSYFLDEMGFWLNYGPFIYTVHFDGDKSSVNTGDLDVEEAIKEWTVKDAKFEMLGDRAADL